jgi:hypothetical protein
VRRPPTPTPVELIAVTKPLQKAAVMGGEVIQEEGMLRGQNNARFKIRDIYVHALTSTILFKGPLTLKLFQHSSICTTLFNMPTQYTHRRQYSLRKTMIMTITITIIIITITIILTLQGSTDAEGTPTEEGMGAGERTPGREPGDTPRGADTIDIPESDARAMALERKNSGASTGGSGGPTRRNPL